MRTITPLVALLLCGKADKCLQAFASVGQREGNKRPDLNNLPPCQQAEAYRKSYRQ